MRPTDALVVVDVQRDFCPGGKLAVPRGDEVVGPINRLLALFPIRVLTQDWHPAGHLSFSDNHSGAAPFSQIELEYGAQVLWPAHCIIGTDGAAFHADLEADRADLVVRKGFRAGIDSYSAFRENDGRTTTGLAGYLRERGAERVYVAGLALDYCVGWSALDAAASGFAATVLTDASRAIDLGGSLEASLRRLAEAGVSTSETTELGA